MATHDNHLRDIPTHRLGATSDTTGMHSGRDRAAIIVWRIAADTESTPDSPAAVGALEGQLTARLARHLLAVYSAVNGVIIDYDNDANLRHAAEQTGRSYLAATELASPDAGDPGPQLAALITMRWPRPATTAPSHDARTLLGAFRRYLAQDGSVVVLITASTNGAAHRDHEQVLLSAAQAAGLRHLHDIVTLTADDGRDAFTYATAADRTGTARDRAIGAPRQNDSTTMMIFGQARRTS